MFVSWVRNTTHTVTSVACEGRGKQIFCSAGHITDDLDDRQPSSEGVSALEAEEYSDNEDLVSVNSECDSEFDEKDQRDTWPEVCSRKKTLSVAG